MNVSISRRTAGFTLMEVLLVIAILLVLGTVSVVSYTKIKASSDRKVAQLLVTQVENAVKRYVLVMNVAPSTEDGLTALATAPGDEAGAVKWKEQGPFFEDGRVPQDPWGSQLGYKRLEDTESESTGRMFRVWSFGPNKEDDGGSGDDIPNWAEQG
ncbi:MAG: type II secretion system protein GspG [Planctomycetes bacterium]|nr:type II secretion system protein GspG [Planctomycetota bacterium]